jgi:hypothetical protein
MIICRPHDTNPDARRPIYLDDLFIQQVVTTLVFLQQQPPPQQQQQQHGGDVAAVATATNSFLTPVLDASLPAWKAADPRLGISSPSCSTSSSSPLPNPPGPSGSTPSFEVRTYRIRPYTSSRDLGARYHDWVHARRLLGEMIRVH